MKTSDLFLKCYGEKRDGQWSVICLDFALASQANTLDEAKAKLEAQIKEYIYDVFYGQDRAYAPELAQRKAPFIYWAKWYYGYLLQQIGNRPKRKQAFCEALPLVPA